jgi:hypothetical protein
MTFELPEGWTEATPGGMATSLDPVLGGIIDQAILPLRPDQFQLFGAQP